MHLKVIVLLLVIIHGNCAYSYANLVYSKTDLVTSNTPPPAKKKNSKTRFYSHKKTKKRKQYIKQRSKLSLKNPPLPFKKDTPKNRSVGATLESIAFFAALSTMPICFIIWIIIGGGVWFNLGTILAALWIILGVIFDATAYREGAGGPSLLSAGYVMLLFTFLSFLGFFFWALAANIPFLLVTSIIWGGLALLSLAVIWIRTLIDEQL